MMFSLSSVGGSKSAEGVPFLLADLDEGGGGPNLRGSKSARTPALQSSILEDDKFGEDVIRSLVTPSKSKGVRDVLEKEKERHRCALKLLPFFYTSEELSNSNTDGTHDKQQLDVTKLQALRVLVFSRFQLKLPRRKKKCGNPSKVKLTRSVALANMYISLLVPRNVNKVELTLCCLAYIGVCFSRSELGWYISQTPSRWTAKSATLFLFISP